MGCKLVQFSCTMIIKRVGAIIGIRYFWGASTIKYTTSMLRYTKTINCFGQIPKVNLSFKVLPKRYWLILVLDVHFMTLNI